MTNVGGCSRLPHPSLRLMDLRRRLRAVSVVEWMTILGTEATGGEGASASTAASAVPPFFALCVTARGKGSYADDDVCYCFTAAFRLTPL